jgi:NtrC-family two-component system sensor histidine kinase KinB
VVNSVVSRKQYQRLTPIIVGALTLMMVTVLLTQLDDLSNAEDYLGSAMVYGTLTLLTLLMGMWLTDGSLSQAHAIGMVAFLSSPEAALPVLIWAIFVGSLVGACLNLLRRNIWQSTTRLYQLALVVLVSARVTLSFFAASQVFIALDGALPITENAWADNRTPLALIVYAAVYIAVYAAIYTLQIYADRLDVQQMVHDNLIKAAIILITPVPFAFLCAEIIHTLSTPAQIFSIFGLIAIIVGMHSFSRLRFNQKRQRNEMTSLAEAMRAMRSQLGVDDLPHVIYEQVSKILGIQDFALIVTHDHLQTIDQALVIVDGVETLTGKHNNLPKMTESMQDFALCKHVITHETPLLLSHDIQGKAAQFGITVMPNKLTSWMAVPMRLSDKVTGVIAVATRSHRQRFTSEHMHLLTIIVSSASIAIDNARLFQRQSEQVSQMVTLTNIASLLSGTLKPSEVLDTIVSSASTLSNANAVALYLSDNENTDPFLVRSAGFSDTFISEIPTPLLIANNTADDPTDTIAIPHIEQDSRSKDHASLLAKQGFESLVELPLVTGDRLIGMLVMYFNAPPSFDTEWLATLKTFGTQATQAIDNARKFTTTDEAFQRSLEQLLVLAQLGQLLTGAIDLNTIANIVLRHAVDSSSAVRGFLILLNAETQQPELTQSYTMLNETISDAHIQSVLDQGVASITLKTNSVERRSTSPANGSSPSGTLMDTCKSQMSLPILRGDTLLGLLALESDSVDAFDEQDSSFLSQIVNQAIIAVENAHLFIDITAGRDRLQVILDTMEEAIILIDQNGQIKLVNPRVDLIGLQASQLADKKINDLVADSSLNLIERMHFDSGSDLINLVDNINEWTAKGPVLYGHSSTTSRRYIQRYIIPVKNESAAIIGALLVFYDKTDEQELMQAREELTRMIVHDLRSPLTAVTTSLKLLQDYVKPENEAYQLVQTTTDSSRRAVKKLLGRVNSLLDIAKMESGRMPIEQDVVELRPVIDTVFTDIRPLAQELDITLTADLPDDLPLLDADADKIERLLQNLLDNAVKYSPMKSTIIVRAHKPAENAANPGLMRIDVIDSGPGVPEDFKARLFQSFVQVEGRKTVRNGVGLGLSFCRMVAEAHGGTIWVADNRPKGSIFSVTLPVIDAAKRLLDDQPHNSQSSSA